MRVLVAGGTGFIGRHVVNALHENGGHQVSVMTRHPSRARLPAGVAAVAGDVTDPASLAQATRGIEAVIHCVQFPNHPVENPRRGWTYEKIDGDGTERLVEACLTNDVRRFVYISGAGVRPGRTEAWFRAKERAETAVQRSGMQWVILRPSWVYGPEDRSLNKFVAFVRYLPIVPVIGSGQERVQPLHVDDVARVAVAALTKGEATNRVFELGSRKRTTMDEILREVMAALGTRRPLIHQPAWLVKIPAWFLQFLPNAPLSPGAIDFITMDEAVDPSEAERVFGVSFRSLDEGLRGYLRPDG
jgi:NADH dehydrogenase